MPVHDDLRQPGDLIFFSRKGDFPTHIGIVASKSQYIHSPGVDNQMVEIKSVKHEDIAAKGIGRALYLRNPIGFKSPVALTEKVSYRYHHRAI